MQLTVYCGLPVVHALNPIVQTIPIYSLGLPRVSYNQNSKLVLISKCQTTVYRNILQVYGAFDEKSAIEGILKAQ